ncbi:MAG: type II toxin-antitoxin system VapC family toxin [Cyanobium sp. 49614_E6]|nr:type II toxin-antitoxin system VapC family toxin [Cyanobium sp. 49614_E6]
MKATAGGLYLDTCVLVSLFHNDSGYAAAETWLAASSQQPLWISHWVLVEFASATALRMRRRELSSSRATRIQEELENFRRERLGLLEPCAEDFLLARRWIVEERNLSLRAGDGLHLAVAHRHRFPLVSADQSLLAAAHQLGCNTVVVTYPSET